MAEPLRSDWRLYCFRLALVLTGSISLVGCESSAPQSMSAWFACSSKSGDQLVLGHLDFVESRGQFRLQFFGQDVFYNVKRISPQGGSVSGTAVFQGSLTGETKAAPFDFVYDRHEQRLKLDGVWNECDVLQDRSLVYLPVDETQTADPTEQQ
ncbi:hypothetical protein [Porphyrobacter sp. ULC335]|uniref:hypothetical protein n=1 Tax=Porphyrobacter sp. ULC335 TaxID=2854260 RepID=UPI002220D144|nr:hypothetical protein [Porphyrobacter sp. ULC335]UYV15509.1 hypothetical protein KVF90_15615 [Porphyrobacter sp. ULC335]